MRENFCIGEFSEKCPSVVAAAHTHTLVITVKLMAAVMLCCCRWRFVFHRESTTCTPAINNNQLRRMEYSLGSKPIFGRQQKGKESFDDAIASIASCSIVLFGVDTLFLVFCRTNSVVYCILHAKNWFPLDETHFNIFWLHVLGREHMSTRSKPSGTLHSSLKLWTANIWLNPSTHNTHRSVSQRNLNMKKWSEWKEGTKLFIWNSWHNIQYSRQVDTEQTTHLSSSDTTARQLEQ